MAWKWYDSHITKIEDMTPTTRRFWLEKKPDWDFTFQAGQFITLDLPIHEKRLKRWRSYSLAGSPADEGDLELCIVKLEGGLASEYLFEKATVGTPVKFKGPAGAFTLSKKPATDLVFICTGTGIAPFRSMLRQMATSELKQPVHLIFGTRREDGMLYQKEMEALQTNFPNFTYSVALSRQATEQHYEGYVHQIYEQAYQQVQPGIHFYICGWSNMVDEAVKKLTEEMGYPKEQVHYELYG